MNTFRFIGVPILPKEKFYQEFEGNNPSHKVSFTIKPSENNAGFVSLIGSKQQKIIAISKDDVKKKLEIKWTDRNNPKYIEMVAPFTRFQTNVGCEDGKKKEFITAWDMVEYLNEELPKLPKDELIKVTGRLKRPPYKGKAMNNFDIQCVWLVKDTEKDKPGLFVQLDLFYDKKSLDTTDENYVLSCYTNEYISKELGNMYVPMIVNFDTTNLDKSNERHMKYLKNRLEYLRDNIGRDKIVNMIWDAKYVRGAEEAEFDESMLTDAQREEIEIGAKTIDDFKNKVYGNNKEIYKLTSPALVGKFKDGLVELDMSHEDFDELIYIPVDVQSDNSSNSSSVNDDSDIDDIV